MLDDKRGLTVANWRIGLETGLFRGMTQQNAATARRLLELGAKPRDVAEFLGLRPRRPRREREC